MVMQGVWGHQSHHHESDKNGKTKATLLSSILKFNRPVTHPSPSIYPFLGKVCSKSKNDFFLQILGLTL